MPFEIAPAVAPAVVESPFKKYADALLIGAAATDPAQCAFVVKRSWPWQRDRTCALGAIVYGIGGREAVLAFRMPPFGTRTAMAKEMTALNAAYAARYGVGIIGDNDEVGRTREHIAERIAAL